MRLLHYDGSQPTGQELNFQVCQSQLYFPLERGVARGSISNFRKTHLCLLFLPPAPSDSLCELVFPYALDTSSPFTFSLKKNCFSQKLKGLGPRKGQHSNIVVR